MNPHTKTLKAQRKALCLTRRDMTERTGLSMSLIRYLEDDSHNFIDDDETHAEAVYKKVLATRAATLALIAHIRTGP